MRRLCVPLFVALAIAPAGCQHSVERSYPAQTVPLPPDIIPPSLPTSPPGVVTSVGPVAVLPTAVSSTPVGVPVAPPVGPRPPVPAPPAPPVQTPNVPLPPVFEAPLAPAPSLSLAVANVRKEPALLFTVSPQAELTFVHKLPPGEAIDLTTLAGQRWVAVFASAPHHVAHTATGGQLVWLLRGPALPPAPPPSPLVPAQVVN